MASRISTTTNSDTIDTTPPEITCPADVTVEQETQEGTGEMDAQINAGESENSTDILNVIQELVDSYDYFAAFKDAEYEAPKRYSVYSMGDSTGGGSDITPPQVTIISADGGRTYTTTEIALAVTANASISRWCYGLNGGDPLPFSPNITITARVGDKSLVVFAEDMMGNVGSASVSFNPTFRTLNL